MDENSFSLMSASEMCSRLGLRNIACTYNTYISSVYNNNIIIPRTTDIVIPEYLEITYSGISLTEIFERCKKFVLTMDIGNKRILNLPLNFLMNLHSPIFTSNKIYINLCFHIFFGELKLISLYSNIVKFELIFREPDLQQYISNYGLVCKEVYLSSEERDEASLQSFEEVFQQISFIDMTFGSDVMSDSICIDLFFEGNCKGFFIESEDIGDLNNLILYTNNQVRFSLNRLLIMTKCIKIYDNMLYFPFNDVKSYLVRTADSFEGSIDLTSLNEVRIELMFDTPRNNVKIYSLNGNIYRQDSGNGEPVFNISQYAVYLNAENSEE